MCSTLKVIIIYSNLGFGTVINHLPRLDIIIIIWKWLKQVALNFSPVGMIQASNQMCPLEFVVDVSSWGWTQDMVEGRCF